MLQGRTVTRLVAIKEFFELTATEAISELKALTTEDKDELAALIAAQEGCTIK